MLRRLRSLLRPVLGRRRFEDGMNEELRFHIEEYAADLVRSGMSEAEALRRARIEFGSVASVQEECREARRLLWTDELMRNVRQSARALRKNPGFTGAAVIPFALCLGANLAIFAVIDSVLLKPLPFPNARRLVAVFKTYPKAGVPRDGASPANYYELRGRLNAFDAVSIYRYETAIVGEAGATEREEIIAVSPDFFSTLGVTPAMGQVFSDAEMTYETDRVAVLTDAAWRKRFSGDRTVIGRAIRMDGVARIVIAVLPPDFRFLSSEARIYVPLSSNAANRRPANRHSGMGGEIIARLRPGVTVSDAQSQVDAFYASVAHEYPQARMIADAGFRALVSPLHSDHVGSIRSMLLLLQAGVFVLLLIGGVNLVNLLLIRASGRAKDMAIRLAMGAGKRHVVSEVMVETLLLTLSGGVIGLIAGAAGIRLLQVLGAEKLPLGTQIAFDGRVALMALAVSISVGVILGFLIAWHTVRSHLGSALQSETRGGTAGRSAQRLRHAFIVAQIAFAIVLLAGAGLLGVSLKKATAVSPGFQAGHLFSAQIALPWGSYSGSDARIAFTGRMLEEIQRQPGVVAAGIVTNPPLSGRNSKSAVNAKDFPVKPGGLPRASYAFSVDGDYFTAMQVPLVEGRFLNAGDSRRAQKFCVVDEEFARFYWPRGGAIGKSLYLGSRMSEDSLYAIVGVVGVVKQADLTERGAQGTVYFPLSHRSERNFFVVARTRMEPERFGASLQQIVRRIDPELPVYDIRSMDTRIADSLMTRRAPALLAGLFAVVALLLAAIGTYGVLSYAVTQRRREIGVRIALGARPDQIRAQFLAVALRLLALGTVLGVTGSWAAGRAMQGLLFDLPALHLATMSLAVAAMGAVCIAACLLPSSRAARISPVEVLAE